MTRSSSRRSRPASAAGPPPPATPPVRLWLFRLSAMMLGLAALLEGRYPGKHFEVVNGTMTATSGAMLPSPALRWFSAVTRTATWSFPAG